MITGGESPDKLDSSAISGETARTCRLDLLSPQLTSVLEMLGPSQQQHCALAACEFALRITDMQLPVVQDAFNELLANSQLSEETTFELELLMNNFDGECLSALRTKHRSAFFESFHKSRAVAALLYAADPEPLKAAVESIYEASQTNAQSDEVISFLMPLAVSEYVMHS